MQVGGDLSSPGSCALAVVGRASGSGSVLLAALHTARRQGFGPNTEAELSPRYWTQTKMDKMTTPTPQSPPLTPDPSWIDLAGFWVSALGAAASTAIAIVAIVLSVGANRSQIRRDIRGQREAWVRSFIAWLDAGTVYMILGLEAAIEVDTKWIDRGNELQTSGRLLESKGADAYMMAATDAREYVADLPLDQRRDASMDAIRLLKFWAENWVDKPENSPGNVVDWLNHLLPRDNESSSDGDARVGPTCPSADETR